MNLTQASSLLGIIFQQFIQIGPLWWLIAIAIGLVCSCSHRILSNDSIENSQIVARGLLGAYIVVLLAVTVFSQREGVDSVDINLDVLSTWLSRLREGSCMRYELFVNAGMLVPVGFLLPIAMHWRLARTMLTSLTLTICVEVLQLVTGRGWFELSDIVLNVLGAALGYGIYVTLRKANELRKKQPTGKHFRR